MRLRQRSQEGLRARGKVLQILEIGTGSGNPKGRGRHGDSRLLALGRADHDHPLRAVRNGQGQHLGAQRIERDGAIGLAAGHTANPVAALALLRERVFGKPLPIEVTARGGIKVAMHEGGCDGVEIGAVIEGNLIGEAAVIRVLSRFRSGQHIQQTAVAQRLDVDVNLDSAGNRERLHQAGCVVALQAAPFEETYRGGAKQHQRHGQLPRLKSESHSTGKCTSSRR